MCNKRAAFIVLHQQATWIAATCLIEFVQGGWPAFMADCHGPLWIAIGGCHLQSTRFNGLIQLRKRRKVYTYITRSEDATRGSWPYY